MHGHGVAEDFAVPGLAWNVAVGTTGRTVYPQGVISGHQLHLLLCGKGGVSVPSNAGNCQCGEYLGWEGVGAIGEVVTASYPHVWGISGDECSHVLEGSVAQWPGEEVVDQLLGKCVSAAEGNCERIRSPDVKEIGGVAAFGECCRSR